MASYNQNYNSVASFQSQYKTLIRRLKANEDKPRIKPMILEMLYLVYTFFADHVNNELDRLYPKAVIRNFDIVDARTVLEHLPNNADSKDVISLLKITERQWGREKRIDWEFKEATLV